MDKLRHDVAKEVYDEILRGILPGSITTNGFYFLMDRHDLSFVIADKVLANFTVKEKRCETCGQAPHS